MRRVPQEPIAYELTEEEKKERREQNKRSVAALVAEDAKAEWEAIRGYQQRLNTIINYLDDPEQAELLEEITAIYREHLADELNHQEELADLYEGLTKITPAID
jgi:rubrerythrin